MTVTPTASQPSHPTIELYGQVVQAYEFFNKELFVDQPLPGCIITLQRKPKTMGYVIYGNWIKNSRDQTRIDELAINPGFWLGWPISEVLSTLVHEQCHIWQNTYGTPGRGRYHNQQWAEKMREIGLIPSDTGLPGGKQTGDHVLDYIELGGQFHKTLQELLKQDFHFPWVALFPEPQTPQEIKIFDDGGKQYSITGEPLSEYAKNPAHYLLPAGATSLSDMPIRSIDTSATPQIAAKRRSKLKYSCFCPHPVNIWGKPNLKVICGYCKEKFKVSES